MQVLFVANKQDLPGAMKLQEIRRVIEELANKGQWTGFEWEIMVSY